MADELTITRPDDWHLHVRDGAALAAVVPHSARQFGARDRHAEPEAAGDDDAAQALAYRERILAALPRGRRRSSR